MKKRQIREKRETNNRENAELKKEIESLKRQVARLTKELRRADNPEESPESEEEEGKLCCPECGSDKLTIIVTPSGANRYACRGCKKWRGTFAIR